MHVRMRMTARAFAGVCVGLMIDLHRNHIDTPVAYAAFSDQMVGKVLHLAVAAAQNGDFHAGVVIKVNVHRRQTRCRDVHETN